MFIDWLCLYSPAENAQIDYISALIQPKLYVLIKIIFLSSLRLKLCGFLVSFV